MKTQLPSLIRFRNLSIAFLAVSLAVLPVGCGDDDADTAPTQGQTEQSLAELSGFGADMMNEPGVQVLGTPAVSNILNVLPLSLPGFLNARTAPAFPAARVLPAAPTVVLNRLTRPGPVPAEIVGFGTYHYDATSTEGPFENWVLDTADVPPDGFVFRFTEEDGFTVLDEDSNEVAIQGEIRLLEVEWSEGLAGPTDDILTHSVIEIAAGHYGTPTAPELYPIWVHVEASVTLDANREVTSVRIGDRTANGTSDPDATYLGHFLMAMEVDVAWQGDLADVGLLLQVYDSLEDYVLRVGTTVESLDDSTGTAEAITLVLGYGETTTPASPPWLYTVTLDNFRPDPTDPVDDEDEIADVSGTITFQGSLAATIFGTTDDNVDLDLDGESDCINTWVTFTSDPGRPVSICVLAIAFLQAFGEFLPASLAPLVM